MIIVAQAEDRGRTGSTHQFGQFRQRRLAVIGRQHLSLPRIETGLFQMQIGHQQGIFRRPVKRGRSDDGEAVTGEQKGNHGPAMR